MQELDTEAPIISNGDIDPFMAADGNPWVPVTVGDKTGYYSVHIHKVVTLEGDSFTPTGFECFGGKENNRKWRLSLR